MCSGWGDIIETHLDESSEGKQGEFEYICRIETALHTRVQYPGVSSDVLIECCNDHLDVS